MRQTGKQALAEVVSALEDIEITDRTDAVIGALATSIVAMVKTSPQDEAYRLQWVVNMMRGGQ